MNKNKQPSSKKYRPIDDEIRKTYSWWSNTATLIKKKNVKTWHGALMLTFISGIIAASIMTISFRIQTITNANGETAELSLDTSNINVAPGNSFTVDIMLNTNNNNVVVTRAIIDYDPANITLTNWDTSNSVFASGNTCIYNNKPCEIVDNDTRNGTISITLAKPSPGVNTSSGLIAKLTFQTNQNSRDDTIRIYFNPRDKYADSDVIFDGVSDDGAGTDILNNVSDAQIHITKPDTTAPILSEVTPIPSPTSNNTPSYTFSSTEAGTISYTGSCNSLTNEAKTGNNTIIFNRLKDGEYSDCKITVTDSAGNISIPLNISRFIVRSNNSGGHNNTGIVTTDEVKNIKVKSLKIKTDKQRGFINLPKYKTVYSKENKVKFRGYVSGLIGGKVQIYVDKKLKGIAKVGKNKLWSKKIKIKNNGRHLVRFKYIDNSNRLVKKSRKYSVRIDTKKPKFKNMPHFLTKHRGEKVWWKATDNNKISYYKYYFNGKKKITKKSSFIIPASTSRGLHMLKIKAYDKAGNRTIQYAIISVF